MAITWGQIRLQCQKFGEDLDLDLLDGFIYERYRTIIDAHPWKALEKGGTLTVTAGSAGTRAIYKLASDCKVLIDVNNSNNMRPYTQAELNMLYPTRPDVGTPKIYSMAEESSDTPPLHQVELYPIPNANGSIPYRYLSIPAEYDPTQMSGSPLPWIPAKAIIHGVRGDILSFAKDYQGMQAFEDLFTADINDMISVELHRQPNSRLAEETRYRGVQKFPRPPRKAA